MSGDGSATRLGEWRRLGDGLWVLVAEPATVNLGLVVGTEAALLIDTGSTPTQGAALRAAVAQITPVPLMGAVLTHWHHDHAFGLAGIGAAGIAHESVAARLRGSDAASEARALGVDPAALAAPQREIAVATALDLGRRRVEIVHLGRGHTDGDLVVLVPDAELVFAGDLIESAAPVSIGADSVLAEWPGTLDGLIGLMTARTVAVPGHGEPVDRLFVFEQRSAVAAAAAEGSGQPHGRTSLPLI